MVIGKNGSDLFLVPISSVFANTDYPLTKWREAGLNVACGVKVQIATVEDHLVLKIVGQLEPDDKKALDLCLRRWLTL